VRNAPSAFKEEEFPRLVGWWDILPRQQDAERTERRNSRLRQRDRERDDDRAGGERRTAV
jgi:hypothetical protein